MSLPQGKPRLALSVQYAVAPGSLPAVAALRRWARAAVEHDARVTLRFVGAHDALHEGVAHDVLRVEEAEVDPFHFAQEIEHVSQP